MSDSRADEILRQHSGMESDRAVFEGHWREIEERVSYKGRYFQNQTDTQGTKSTDRIFDVTAPTMLRTTFSDRRDGFSARWATP
jgi:hypothetical protein